MTAMKWERLADVRTVLLIVIGCGALVAGTWLKLGTWGGLIALGVVCFFLEFMTGQRPPQEQGAQRGR